MEIEETYDWSYSRFYPLHAATQLGDINTVEALVIKHGLSPNETDYDYLTPLHIACFSGHVPCAELLINYGAQINARSIDGATPLCGASSSGHYDLVQLLLSNGALVNPVHSLSTPLHEAAFSGSVDCVNALITSGALLNTYDCNFGTPLHAAVHQNRYKCVKSLLLAGANVNATKFHESPLHLAVCMNHVESALELLRFGANVFLTNNQGKKAIDLCRHKTGILYEALDFAQKQPRILQDLCRQVLGKNQKFKKLLSLFYLPQPLVDYINFDR